MAEAMASLRRGLGSVHSGCRVVCPLAAPASTFNICGEHATHTHTHTQQASSHLSTAPPQRCTGIASGTEHATHKERTPPGRRGRRGTPGPTRGDTPPGPPGLPPLFRFAPRRVGPLVPEYRGDNGEDSPRGLLISMVPAPWLAPRLPLVRRCHQSRDDASGQSG